jgi:hypothetical protein
MTTVVFRPIEERKSPDGCEEIRAENKNEDPTIQNYTLRSLELNKARKEFSWEKKRRSK